MHRSSIASVLLIVCAAIVCPGAARAEEDSWEPDCFDAVVSATIVRQTPTDMADCGEGCIMISWPWIVDLDIERVLKGRAPLGPAIVLTVQHTYYIASVGDGRWWLRRNTLGVFNAVGFGKNVPLPRCAADAIPMKPFVHPGPGRTLRDLRRAGENRYGRRR